MVRGGLCKYGKTLVSLLLLTKEEARKSEDYFTTFLFLFFEKETDLVSCLPKATLFFYVSVIIF